MKQNLVWLVLLFFANHIIAQTYKNPVISGFNPDPSVCWVGDDFYLTTSSFGYFPGVPVYHSKDLIHWKHINYCLKTEKQLPLSGSGIQEGVWAPTLRHHKGKFYMVTTCNRKNFFVSTNDPAGNWSDPVFLDIKGYDPSFLFANDSLYLTWANHNAVFQCLTNPENGKLITSPKIIFHEKKFHGTEGPHVYKIGEYFYLMVAHGGTALGHRESIFRSKSPWGPWESHPQNPILKNYLDRLAIVQATGHADLVEAPDGSWWMVHLGIRNFGGMTDQFSNLGRETFLMPLNWENGWPFVSNNGYSRQIIQTNLLKKHYQRLYENNNDEFNNDELQLYWNFIGNPNPELWSLEEKNGWLTLFGNENNLDSTGSFAFIGRRQTGYNCEASVLLEFEPKSKGEEAGITVFMDRNFHYDLFVSIRNRKKVVVARRRAMDINFEENLCEISGKQVELIVLGYPKGYIFYVKEPGKEKIKLADMNSKFISIHNAGKYYSSFTGMYLGMYATGNGAKVKNPAFFDYFRFSESEPEKGYSKNLWK